MSNLYDIGDVVTMYATFTDPKTNKKVSPEHVTCTVLQPRLVSPEKALTPSTTEVETGVFEATVEVDRWGRWYYAFDGEGGVQASEERSFEVRARQVPR